MEPHRQRQDPPGPARRIGLIGAECSGKSSLAIGIAEALPACVVDEELRHFVDRTGRPPRAEEQAALLHRQVEREDDAAAHCSLPWLVADPAPLMTAVYSLHYFDDASLLPTGIAHAHGYDLVVRCAIDIPWEPDDGQRDGPVHRASTDGLIEDVVLPLLAREGIPFLTVEGESPDRLRSVIAAVGRAWQPGRAAPPT